MIEEEIFALINSLSFEYYGIKRQLIVAYTPQQNDIAKRKIQTIVEMIRSMLQSKHLSNMYWVDVMRKLIYILNKSLTSILDDITTYEV